MIKKYLLFMSKIFSLQKYQSIPLIIKAIKNHFAMLPVIHLTSYIPADS